MASKLKDIMMVIHKDLSEFVKYFVLISVYICVVKVIWREAVVLVTVVPEVGRHPVRRWGWATTQCTPPLPTAVQEVMESLGVSVTQNTKKLFLLFT